MATSKVVTKELQEHVEKLIKKVTLETTAELIEATPVDTGWARANWVPNINERFDKTAGTRQNAERGTVDISAQQQGKIDVLIRYKLPDTIFVSNNVEYISALNDGHSLQAPAGFVQQSIAKAIQNVSSGG